jgi:hypothetical protein
MNYTWTEPIEAIKSYWRLDYSREVIGLIDENDLDEAEGLQWDVLAFVPVGPPDKVRYLRTQGPVDYNDDGDKTDTGLAADLNHFREVEAASPGQSYSGHDDWTALVYSFRESDDYGRYGTTSPAHEITTEIIEFLEDIPPPEGEECRPDCNKDGRLNINDFICFQREWRAKSAYGDFNSDGRWNINDFIAFQAAFRVGCP